jgi:dGTPase
MSQPFAQQIISDIQRSAHADRQDAGRTTFQRDFDRVIYSDYFRSLSSKTQVIPLPGDDHTHNRLTHSLEVASIGRNLGHLLATSLHAFSLQPALLDHLPDILATACLVHDIGNPPMGHSGEEALQAFFTEHFQPQDGFCRYRQLSLTPDQHRDFAYFDGNANGFRVITRLAGRHPEYPEQPLAKSGFSLSLVTLASFLKYPFTAGQYPGQPDKKKFSVFQEEYPLFLQLCQQLEAEDTLQQGVRHPLAYLVEAADDIAYLVMDFEDALKNGQIRAKELFETITRLFGEPTRTMKQALNWPELEQAIVTLNTYNLNSPINRRYLKALETVRARAVEYLVKQCFAHYQQNLEAYGQPGLQPSLINQLFACKAQAFTQELLHNKVYLNDQKIKLEISGHRVIHDLLTLFLNALSEFKTRHHDLRQCSRLSRNLLSYLMVDLSQPQVFGLPKQQLTDYQLCLMACDFITRCSDKTLIRLHRSFTEFDQGV